MARILVIDDEELARFTLREILEAAGHEVIEASNGNEGTAFQRANPCDVVITDMIMPEKEGLETIVELKGEYPDLKIIAISGGGRNRIIIKPFSEEDLMAGLAACLPKA